jgi:peptidoglycan/LPS O-acetylase OafA/YrhL
MIKKRSSFYPEIESLRGIAALVVAGLHCFTYWFAFRRPEEMKSVSAVQEFFFGAGASAVTLFFVISGFVLIASIDRIQRPTLIGMFAEFTWKRVARIYPVIIVSVLVFAAISPWVFLNSTDFPEWERTLQNASLWSSDLIAPTWSTRVEIAATPIFFLGWLARRQGILLLVAFGLLLVALAFAPKLYDGDLIGKYLFVFAFGMLIPDLKGLFERLPAMLATVVLVLAVTMDIRARPGAPEWHYEPAILREAICCTLIVGLIAFGRINWLREVLLIAPIRALGRISFSFYVLHFPVILMLIRHLPDFVVAADPTLAGLEVWLITTVLTVPLSFVTWAYVEKTGIAFGRLFAAPVGAEAPAETIAFRARRSIRHV